MEPTPTMEPDPDKGKLFDLPRVKVVVDDSDPNVVKLAFSGSYELDREDKDQMEHYNRLRAGQEAELVIGVHVAGARKTHRRDAEGYVDAVVEVKTLKVSEVYFQAPEEE
jgi:hypothetical protein